MINNDTVTHTPRHARKCNVLGVRRVAASGTIHLVPRHVTSAVNQSVLLTWTSIDVRYCRHRIVN